MVAKKTKKDKDAVEEKPAKEVKNDIPLYQMVLSLKSFAPLAVILGLTFVIVVAGLFNYKYSFNISLFEDIYTSITSFEILNFPLLNTY